VTRRGFSILAVALLAAVVVLRAAPARADATSIKHVYVIVLENESASTTFAPGSPAPYLASQLTAQGAFVPNYYGIGHNSNDNYIAMISGQAPNTANQEDCQTFSDFVAPSTAAGSGACTRRASQRSPRSSAGRA
jgi:phosphatidylinositol-3-phosphatase